MSQTHSKPGPKQRRTLTRHLDGGHVEVGHIELFFDLVYVFAVTQLSHFVLKHPDLFGVLGATVLFLIIWWVWVWMTWATNWLDTDRGPVRLVIFAVMLAGLVMSASIPHAFGEAGLVFVAAVAGTQIGRTLFLAWAVRERPETSRNLIRAPNWMIAAWPRWAAGALPAPKPRLVLWAAAVMMNLTSPLCRFWVPGLGASKTTDFSVSGAHMAERCALFIIIALGEGIIVTGATFAEMKWDGPTIAAFLTAFTGTVAMWWIYFDRGARQGAKHIEHHEDSGRVARDAYTYLHIPIVADRADDDAGDELLLAHPVGHTTPLFVFGAVGGSALFLAGCGAFKRVTGSTPWFPVSHWAGLGLLAAIALWALLGHPGPLAVGVATVAALIGVAVWEWRSFHGGWTDRPPPQVQPKGKITS